MSTGRSDPGPPTAEELRAAFDAPAPLTVGLEEELMLLDPETFDLVPVGPDALARMDDDSRFKLELPASQLEIVTAPAPDVPTAMRELAAGRAELAARTEGLARPAAAAVHPFSATEGELNDDERYRRTAREFGRNARRQLVCALQVHVAVGSAAATLAVYNGLRSYLPELAALAAAAPFHDGRDTGLASVRPKIAEELPRQGVPPAIESWEAFAAALGWGAAAEVVPEPAVWWWELRPHPAWGTLELRVPDAQATLADAGAVAALAHALVGWLTERHERGEDLGADATWRIEENRWSACRWGVEGTLADLRTGARSPTRDRLRDLIDAVAPTAARLGCAAELDHARALADRNGAMRLREVAAERGIEAVAAWLAERFGDGLNERREDG
jgi:glutamate---cysteine ligase / carboxylate-amine ligase